MFKLSDVLMITSLDSALSTRFRWLGNYDAGFRTVISQLISVDSLTTFLSSLLDVGFLELVELIPFAAERVTLAVGVGMSGTSVCLFKLSVAEAMYECLE